MGQYTLKERRLMLLCFIAYTGAYISRTNLSPALDALQKSFSVSAAKIGLIPTLFALPYAAGQIVTGLFAEKKDPVTIIGLGLIGSALANILFSFSQSYGLLLVIWFINGCFQSMVWTPVLCILTREFREETRDGAIFFVTVSLISGYLVAWLVSGLLTSHFSWRAAFRGTGLLTLLIAVFTGICFRRTLTGQAEGGAAGMTSAEMTPKPSVPLRRLFFTGGLIWVLLSSSVNGYVKDGIMNWAPKLLMDTQGIDLSGAVGVILIIPVINFFGIEAGKLLYRKLGQNVSLSCFWLMISGVVFSLLTAAFHKSSPVLCTVLLALCSAGAYAVNPLITSFMPIRYEATGHLPFVAGLIDAAIYVGSAVSGFAAGYLCDTLGWTAVFISWAVFSAVGAVLLIIAEKIFIREAGALSAHHK